VNLFPGAWNSSVQGWCYSSQLSLSFLATWYRMLRLREYLGSQIISAALSCGRDWSSKQLSGFPEVMVTTMHTVACGTLPVISHLEPFFWWYWLYCLSSQSCSDELQMCQIHHTPPGRGQSQPEVISQSELEGSSGHRYGLNQPQIAFVF
jgi:hypothetical protein